MRTFALDIETLASPTKSVQDLRLMEAKKMAVGIMTDRTLPPSERRYIDKRLTDFVKIEAAIQKKLDQAAQLERSKDSVNPLTAEPICVCCVGMDESLIGHVNSGTPINGYALQTFTDMGEFYHWASQEVDQFIGFNIDQFDIPCLRMHQARTTHGTVLRIKAFWNSSIDLRREFGDIYNKGETFSTPRSLLYYVATILDKEAQQEGVVKEYLTSTFAGADVGAAYVDWETGGKEKIIRHCTLDTLMVALIAVKLGIYR